MFDFDKIIERRGDGSKKWNTYGEDVLPMFIADMDFRAPEPVLDAVRKKLDFGVFGYQFYKQTIESCARGVCRMFNVEVLPEWIVMVPSLEPALALFCSVRSGAVLLPVPTYFHIVTAPRLAGREAVHSELLRTIDDNGYEHYSLDYEDIKRKTSGSGDGRGGGENRASSLILCSPHNPVGRVYSLEELTRLSEIARENDVLVLSDEAHSELIFGGRKHIPYWTVDDYAFDNSITIMSPGKCYNLAAFPFGFAVIPNAKLRHAFKRAYYAETCPGVLYAAAAEAAYSGECDGWKAELLEYLHGNVLFFEEGLKRISKNLRFPKNEATYLQWVDFSLFLEERGFGKDADAPRILLEEAKIAVSPGPDFGGAAGEGGRTYGRFNLGTNRSRVEEALNRISNLGRQV